MTTVHIDFETRSAAELKDVGVYVYAEHSSTDAWCLAWGVDEEAVNLWTPDLDDGWFYFLKHHIADPKVTFVAHNSQFEHVVWHGPVKRRYGWPELSIDKMRCTMAAAYSMSLPGSLDQAAAALGLDTQKDMAGHRLMMQMAKPRRIEPDGTIVWWNEPEKLQRLYAYCKTDVEVERLLDKRLRALSPAEQRIWHLDQTINRRGVAIDKTLCHRAQRVVERATVKLDAKLKKTTDGAVSAVSNVQQLATWVRKRAGQRRVVTDAIEGMAETPLAERNYGWANAKMASMSKDAIVDLLEEWDLPEDVETALLLRQEGGKTSTAKIQKFLDWACADGRVRGMLQYHGAGTGRWAGRGPQPQNLSRPKIKNHEITEAIDLIMGGQDDLLEMLYGGVPSTVSDCIRGMIVPGPGRKLYSADFANIEGRVLAWWAGERWKLRAFEAYDAGKGPDLYKVAASGIFGVPIEKVDGDKRQIGKVAELACFGADTLVLTEKSGYKVIVEVAPDDRVWDGVEWVNHGGVICRGEKETIDLVGIAVTPDHLILTGSTWKPAQQLAFSASTLSRALGTGSANLPSAAFNGSERHRTNSMSLCDARAALHPTKCSSVTFALVDRPGATDAPKRKQAIGVKSTTGTLMSFLTTAIGAAFWTAFPRVLIVATTPTTRATSTTAAGACTSSRRGGLTAEPSWHILSRWTAGMIRPWNLTAEKSTGATSQGISGLSPDGSTRGIAARSKTCSNALLISSRKTLVYDLTLCSDRQRFTVLTNAGPLIVHNCGYQGGVGAFVAMAKTYALKIERYRDVIIPSAALEHVERAEETYANLKRKPAREVYVPAEIVKLAWRDTHPATVQLWRKCEDAVLAAVATPGSIHAVNGVRWRVNGSFLWCQLPGGRLICYPYPRIVPKEMPWGEVKDAVTYKGVDSRTRKWGDQYLYGGKIVENVVQAVARDVMAEAMVRVEEAGYEVVMTVHDEVVGESTGGSIEEFKTLMATLPVWAKANRAGDALPVSVEGWSGARYRK